MSKNEIIEKKLINIAILIFLYACYFNAVKTISLSYVTTLVIGIIFLVLAFFFKRKRKISAFLPIFLYTFNIFISDMYSIDNSVTERYLIIFIVFLIITCLLRTEKKWEKAFMNFIVIFSLINVIITIVTWINPEWYLLNILPQIYDKSRDTMYNLVVYAKSFPGIFASTGVSAFYITAGLSILFSNILNNQGNRGLNYCLTALFVFALILTLKRATLVINIVAILTILLLKNTKISNKIKYIILAIIAFGIMYCIFPDVFENVISRFNANNTKELLNGRDVLYEYAKRVIEKNFFWGLGYGCFATSYNINIDRTSMIDAHNEFLQTFAETGIFGMLIIFVPIITILIKTMYRYSKITNEDKKVKIIFTSSLYIQIYFILYCLVGNPLHDTSIYFIYLLFVLLIYDKKGDFDEKTTKKSINYNTSI